MSVFDVRTEDVDPSAFDFLILATPVIHDKLLITDWLRDNLSKLDHKPIIMIKVSGAPPGPKLDAWVRESLPQEFLSKVTHVSLRGRQRPNDLSWYNRAMLIVATLKNPDPVASREELEGFDYMDKDSIAPISALAEEYTARELKSSASVDAT